MTGQGVFVAPGALIDVSGGWEISTAGQGHRRRRGQPTLQGSSLVVDGTLLGASLIGNKGGSITMTAPNITIAAAPGALPAGFYPDLTLPLTAGLYGLYGQLVFGANQLDQSGFTNITLKSVNDITMEGGLTLGPSLVKLAQPIPGGGSQDVIPGLFSLHHERPEDHSRNAGRDRGERGYPGRGHHRLRHDGRAQQPLRKRPAVPVAAEPVREYPYRCRGDHQDRADRLDHP